MFYVRLLLFSILLYNTEASLLYNSETGTYEYSDMSEPSKSNITEPTASKNVTKAKSVTFTDLEPTALTVTTKPEDHDRNTTATTPYYRHGDNEQKHAESSTTESSYDETVSNSNYTVVTNITSTGDDKQPANGTNTPYHDDDEYGYLTVENGFITANFSETSNETKLNSSNVHDKTVENPWITNTTAVRPYNSYWGFKKRDQSETTTTRRPYYSNWGTFKTTNTTRLPSYSYWGFKRNASETTTTRKPYYSYWGNVYSNDTPSTRVDFDIEPTNTTEPSYSYWGYKRDHSETTTTRRPYHSSWGTFKATNKTRPTLGDFKRNHFESWTTRRPYDSYWGNGYYYYRNISTTRKPYDRNVTESWNWNKNVTVIDEKENTTDLYNTTVDGKTNTSVKFEDTTTIRPNQWTYTTKPKDRYNWTDPYGPRETTTPVPREPTTDRRTKVDPSWPTSPRSPVKISINSSINTNEGRSYGTVADFLKKLAGTILPSAGNIAPNSNVTNLAVANGNGNIFFYVSK